MSRVRRFGQKTGTRFLSLRHAPRPEENSGTGFGDSPHSDAVPAPSRRVAFLLPRAVGNAVARNRLKRRLREIYRRNKSWFPIGFDYLVQPTPAAGKLSFAELLEQVRMAARIEQNSDTRNQNSELRPEK